MYGPAQTFVQKYEILKINLLADKAFTMVKSHMHTTFYTSFLCEWLLVVSLV